MSGNDIINASQELAMINLTCQYNDSYNKILADIFVTSCSPFTVIFNIFVIYLAVKYINWNQSFEQYYVLSMTFADLMVGLLYMTSVQYNQSIPKYFCRLYYILIWSVNAASVMFLLLLNLHKVVILFFPLYSFAYMSKGKVLSQVVICWTVVFVTSTCFGLEPTLQFQDSQCNSCIVTINPKLYFINISCFYILPLVISLILSVLIFGFAQKRSNLRTNQESAYKERQKMFARIFFVFTSTLWTAAMFLPYRISYSRILLCRHLVYFSGESSEDEQSRYQLDQYYNYQQDYYNNSVAFRDEKNLYDIDDSLIKNDIDPCTEYPIDLLQCLFLCMLAIGTVFNPVITIFTQKAYRDGIKDMWKKITKFRQLENCRQNSANNKTNNSVAANNVQLQNRTYSYDAVNSSDL